MKHPLRTVALMAALSAGVFAASPATACEVKDGSIQLQMGAVGQYGDLKVRMAQIDETGKWGIIDIKSPDYSTNGVRMTSLSSLKLTSCGQDVTVTFDWSGNLAWPVIRVSVF